MPASPWRAFGSPDPHGDVIAGSSPSSKGISFFELYISQKGKGAPSGAFRFSLQLISAVALFSTAKQLLLWRKLQHNLRSRVARTGVFARGIRRRGRDDFEQDSRME